MEDYYEIRFWMPSYYEEERMNEEREKLESIINDTLEKEGIKKFTKVNTTYLMHKDGEPGGPPFPIGVVMPSGDSFYFSGDVQKNMEDISAYIKHNMKKNK